jgi:hypothetical protein
MANTDFEMFEKSWRETINKLDKGVIDGRGAQRLYLDFNHNKLRLEMYPPLAELADRSMTQKIDLLYSELTRAIEMAHTRYDLQNKKLLAKILIPVFGSIIALVTAILIHLYF